LLLLYAAGCSDSDSGNETNPPPGSDSAFSSVEVAANDSAGFTNPLSGTPLPEGGVAFIALLPGSEEEPGRPALLRADSGEEPRVLYSGDLLQNPLDLDVSADGASILVADSVYLDENAENAGGSLLTFSIDGGDPVGFAIGFAPRAVTVADSGEVYFSGTDPDSNEPGVFELAGDSVTAVYVGAPLVDPSGIAVFGDGRLLVADTSFSDGDDSTIASRAAVVLLDDGEASVFASGFETGYPAGLALTKNDGVLIVSGQGPDSSNLVFLFDTANPDAEPLIETGFASEMWSSGGLHRAHGENRFAWCDRAAEGGTIYSIEAN
jgi:DNA-binding beta-propeller fold protein YncE